jgi:hypothetical protein
MTSEQFSGLTIDINKEILWRLDFNQDLKNIPKFLLFDCARKSETKIGIFHSDVQGIQCQLLNL